MRFEVGLAAVAVLMCSPAAASEFCSGNAELLTVTEWAIEPIDDQYNSLTVTTTSQMVKGTRMIDASVGFVDALGGHIASYTVDRDAKIAPGGSFEQTGRWGPYTFERLLGLEPEDVSAYTCVRAVLYDDGTKEEF